MSWPVRGIPGTSRESDARSGWGHMGRAAKRKRIAPRTEADLRRRAEEELRAGEARPTSEYDALRLLHELEVHRIELELQNAELQATRADLEVSLARSTQLFDFAPVGYCTVSRGGTIREINLAGASLLGRPPERLIGACLATFVRAPDLVALH